MELRKERSHGRLSTCCNEVGPSDEIVRRGEHSSAGIKKDLNLQKTELLSLNTIHATWMLKVTQCMNKGNFQQSHKNLMRTPRPAAVLDTMTSSVPSPFISAHSNAKGLNSVIVEHEENVPFLELWHLMQQNTPPQKERDSSWKRSQQGWVLKQLREERTLTKQHTSCHMIQPQDPRNRHSLCHTRLHQQSVQAITGGCEGNGHVARRKNASPWTIRVFLVVMATSLLGVSVPHPQTGQPIVASLPFQISLPLSRK